MIAAVAKWGNSLALRIPTAFAREISVREGGTVDISVTNGVLLVRPVDDTHVYDLEALLCGITEENRHDEVATGKSVGNEF
ncbi:AbrB/MazE/SpoVT family DNA-binding domain-containing protein [Mesorhizobium sp.]|uniref:AbrB/MazE/SpoVT family DNA-binding domain-containing protein n=1 Tax=Mesorhizobium sp. TaxID=1871066 RepID=UPI000FE7E877|nr:AbrB/MazE/SpoVT family DNA-binding domain-containing protein [Mesorhizobium sp.]RWK48541.1 MAG: AbrB/MazE/SpoVT family DNA-binding domain-containing protein [Mesorhizobium sp.]